jgi:micrococcal nuclease
MTRAKGPLSFLLVIGIVLALNAISPTAARQPLSVTLVSLTSPVSHGNAATISVQTAPGAACAIIVMYKSGPSRARGLVPKTAARGGIVSWTWIVGTRTTPGKWPLL